MISITETEFTQLADYIRTYYGIQLKKEKRALVMGRLHQALLQKGFHSFTEYFRFLEADQSGAAAAALIDRITTNHTFFMRENDHFRYFQDEVLPDLADSVKDRDLRIWSAGCSSGEEPYTIAMVLDQFFGSEKAKWDTRVLATDISGRMLDKAAKAVYADEQLALLPAHWRQAYFKRLDGGRSMVTERLRKEVIFRRFNLMDEAFPFRRKFHVIFCRNVMIYFNSRTRETLVNKFHDLTERDGYLFIGHSESLNRETTPYKYVMPAVYRKV